MLAKTKYFGEIEYYDADIINLADGLFGFEDKKQYLLIHFNANNNDLFCLQSLQDESLSFVVINPFSFMEDYNPEPSEDDIKALNLAEDSTITYYTFCAIGNTFKESTVNLKCPLLINSATRDARQIILDNPEYCFNHSLTEVNPAQKEETLC